MFLSIITLITALIIASVAGWFSIVGIMAIFSAAAIPAAIMGASLELGKVVTASWLKNNWYNAPWSLKAPLVSMVLILMLITSMGIFGFLSKAHLDQNISTVNNGIQIERLQQQIDRENRTVQDAQVRIDQLDETVNTLIAHSKISGSTGARAVRDSQKEERIELENIISNAQSNIDKLEDTKLTLNQEIKTLEVEIGPIKYISDLVFGEQETNLDRAVQFVIIAFIFVFDPLAVLMLIAANHSLQKPKRDEPDKSKKDITKEDFKVNTNEEKELPPVEAPVAKDKVEKSFNSLPAKKITK